jgi:hypothetical protein
MVFAFAQVQILSAQFYRGNDLIESMREADKADANTPGVDWSKAHEFSAYVAGVYDATYFLYDTPRNLVRGQVVAIVSKYFKDHPERWSELAAELVRSALLEAFPKRNSNQ